MTALPAWRDGNAPNTIGEPVKPGVYNAMPNNSSIAASPAGDPCIE